MGKRHTACECAALLQLVRSDRPVMNWPDARTPKAPVTIHGGTRARSGGTTISAVHSYLSHTSKELSEYAGEAPAEMGGRALARLPSAVETSPLSGGEIC